MRLGRWLAAGIALGALATAPARAEDQLLIHHFGDTGFRVVTLADTTVSGPYSNFEFPSWSQDGAHLIGRSSNGIEMLDPDGSNRKVLTPPDGYTSSPRFSPDGKRYLVRRGSDLVVGSVDGGSPAAIVSDARGGLPYDIAWSSQDEIAYISLAAWPDLQLIVMKSDGSDRRTVLHLHDPGGTPNTFDQSQAIAFSPDGNTLAATRYINTSDNEETGDSFYDFKVTTLAVHPGGVASDRLVGTGHQGPSTQGVEVTGVFPSSASFAPDGRRLAVSGGNNGDRTHIDIYDVTTGALTPIGAQTFIYTEWRPSENHCAPGDLTSLKVANALAEGCFREREDTPGHGIGVYETSTEAWVGGFDLRPRPGGKLVIEPANTSDPLRQEGAGVDLAFDDVLLPAPLDEIHPFVTSYSLGFNSTGSFERFLAFPLLNSATAQVTVTWDSDGTGAGIEGSVSLEELSESLGTVAGNSVGTLAGKLKLKLKNKAAADLTEAELQIPEFATELKDTTPKLKLGFGGASFKGKKVNGAVEWSAEVTTLFPFQDRQGGLTGRLFLRDSSLSGLGFAITGLKIPIGSTGWFLSGVNGDLVLSPELGFNVGIEANQPIGKSGVTLFKMTGNIKGLKLATDCGNGANPFEFVGTANAPELEDRNIGKLTAQVLMCAYVKDASSFAFEAGISGELTVDIGRAKKIASAKGSASGWFHGTDFNLEGHYELNLPIVPKIAADGLLSSEGYAVCGTYGFISAGIATNNWLVAPHDLVGCDFSPYRVATSSARAAATTRRVHVAPGERAISLAIRGASNAPHVLLLGPGGARLRADRALKRKASIVVPVPALRTTYVFLRRPRGGAWRIRPLAGAITRVDTARRLPDPRVRGKVTTRGKRRQLVWSARRIRGQRIAIVDRTPTGVVTLQRSTSRHRGRIRFKPSVGAARHTIEAQVVQDGVPRARLKIARYRVSG